MKLLYVSAGHPLQEADDCLMWDKLGIEWFSTGYYATSNQPGDLPYINMKSREIYLEEYLRQNGTTHAYDVQSSLCGQKNFTWTSQVIKNQWKFDNSFLSRFDVILFNYFVDNIKNNESILANKNICIKTYSMHPPQDETRLKHYHKKMGLKIIRNSPKEHLRCKSNNWAGYTDIIRGSVVRDEHEISGWSGQEEKVCTFTSYLLDQKGLTTKRFKQYSLIYQNAKYPCDYFGIGNNFILHEHKLDVLRNYRVNLVTGTPGANNTYSFVEAWIMGQPIVVFGKHMWDSPTYEADELITHGETGFVGNTPQECVQYIKELMSNYDLAKKISVQARQKAISIYGREVLSNKWKGFFNSLGLSI